MLSYAATSVKYVWSRQKWDSFSTMLLWINEIFHRLLLLPFEAQIAYYRFWQNYKVLPVPKEFRKNRVPYVLTRISVLHGNVFLGYSIPVFIFVIEAKKLPGCHVFLTEHIYWCRERMYCTANWALGELLSIPWPTGCIVTYCFWWKNVHNTG